MEFLIVTGLSGAGKSVTINALEDIGFYCVDNIPSKLVVTFYDLCERAKEDFFTCCGCDRYSRRSAL